MEMHRREFLRYALVGAAAFAGGSVVGGRLTAFMAPRPGGEYRLAMTEALVAMVDHTPVYHWAFEDLDQLRPMPQMPGPLIDAVQGEVLRFEVTNNLSQVHGFRIPGVPGELGDGLVIEPGETAVFEFEAPQGGSYMYFDHLNDPVHRVLGLQGPLIVLPADGNTPYSNPTPTLQRLFDDLGNSTHFPGEPWIPERTRVWFINSIDPRFNVMARAGREIDPLEFRETFLPRYFTINGVSGAYAAHDPSVVPSGRIGQPHLIRIMNAGMAAHSLHLHANHFYVLRNVPEGQDGQSVRENLFPLDSVTVSPADRMDWMVPFKRPPDIPGNRNLPLRELLREELATVKGDVDLSHVSYPMHCHMEMSQTAAGGNYPQGLVTGWEITGDLDGVDFPVHE